MKPSDDFGIPLCQKHHRLGHDRGHATMAREGGTTLEKLFEIAAAFSRATPDKALRQMLRERDLGA